MQTQKRNGSLLLYCLIALLLILTASLLHQLYLRYFRDTDTVFAGGERRALILDAGHGGFDGGAVSVTGTAEKTLNLETTLTLAELLRLLGYEVILTRDSDVSLTSEAGGSRKMQDLRGRLAIAEANPDTPFLSIHMNKFPQNRYRGLQIYYSPNHPAGETLAECMQSAVRTALQPENERAVKSATSAIYLLHRIQSPAVLIECGFLSNADEALLLEDPVYRTKLAIVLTSSYTAWHTAVAEAE